MYAVTARATFGYVSEVVDKIRVSKGKDRGENVPVEEIPIVLVGNKVDLVDGGFFSFAFHFFELFYFEVRAKLIFLQPVVHPIQTQFLFLPFSPHFSTYLTPSLDRAVATDEGAQLAAQLGLPESFFFEASAKAVFYVKEAFEKLTRQCIENWQRENGPSSVAGGPASHHHHRCITL